jgi:zinc/manganese transport system substrate-binding protein
VTGIALRAAALGAAVGSALLLAGCGGGPASGPVTATGDPTRCPGPQVKVVVSVSQWGDLVRDLGGDCASVTTVLASSTADPHDYEPTPADIAAFTDADVVVLNGAGYDSWAEKAAGTLDRAPDFVTAADVAPQPGGNPHLWYSPEAVEKMARAVTAELAKRSPTAAGYFAHRATETQAALAPYFSAVATAEQASSGRNYAATEPVFDLMASALGLADRTPAGYQRAVSNESDPAPGDLTAFQRALADGSVDVLVVNTQTSGRVVDQLRADAEKAGVPVVAVTESPPPGAGSFVAWQVGQLQKLSAALDRTR